VLTILDITVTSLRRVSAWQCQLQDVNTKLKTICSRNDYIGEFHNLQYFMLLITDFMFKKYVICIYMQTDKWKYWFKMHGVNNFKFLQLKLLRSTHTISPSSFSILQYETRDFFSIIFFFSWIFLAYHYSYFYYQTKTFTMPPLRLNVS
jgi:hypothetical protein